MRELLINMQNIATVLAKHHTHKLDAEILLAHTLNASRTYLHAYQERVLTATEQHQFNTLINQYEDGTPIAYLTGHREFWSLDLLVTKDTLIPRPETELLVEFVLNTSSRRPAACRRDPCQVVDLGTGSGAIALALAAERPEWTITATDISSAALNVAKTNAARLNVRNVHFYEGSWFDAVPKQTFDFIISNPPYVAENDEFLEKSVINHEPKLALISPEAGLKDLREIIISAKNYLNSNGYLVVEHGFRQAEAVRCFFLEAGYTDVFTYQDLSHLDRMTVGQLRGA